MGGTCGAFQVQSGAIKATAAITCAGGNSTGVAGGAGGAITLVSTQAATSYTSVTSPGGTGSAAGASGTVTVDGNAL